jgi:alpha-L-rhamnosidase
MHGPRQPAWDFYSDSLDFIARNSFIFQSGIPKMDIVLYQYVTTFPNIVRNYQPTDLEESGYAYEYLSPNNFNLAEAYVSGGVLARNAQGFKALVVRANDSMTVPGVQKIVEYAHAGLPVLFSGGIPTYLASYNESGIAYINQTLNSLKSLSNVHVVPYEGLADTIASFGITPLTRVDANSTWYTYWRQTDDYNYVFVYNDAVSNTTRGLGNGYSKGSVEFASTGTPYALDAWTGREVPILNYTQTSNSTTIPLHLAGNQSVIVAFALSSSNYTTLSSNSSYSLSDPSQFYPPATAGTPIGLTNWSLIVEHWDPPSNLSKMLPSDIVKYNTTHRLLDGLLPWNEISGGNLQNTSGRGYYSTNFTWSRSPSSGAIIDFGAIYHTIRATVNGFALPPLDTAWAKADISDYVVPGENKVEAVVATTLLNVLRPLWNQLQSSGNGTGSNVSYQPAQGYGLISPVKVIPYCKG